MLALATQRDLFEDIGWAHYWLGCALYQANDLTGAEAEFAAVVALRYATHAFPFSQSAFGLASIQLARGAASEARQLVDSVTVYALDMHNGRIQADAEAFRAWVGARSDALNEAAAWAAATDPDRVPAPLNTFVAARALRADVLLRWGTPHSLALAEQALAQLHSLSIATHNTLYQIQALALQALLHLTRGEHDASLAVLQRAVDLAERGGLVRVFVDLGPRMADLLRQLAPAGETRPFLRTLVAAFVAPPTSTPAHEPGGNHGPATPEGDGLIEPLTERELEVLVLLGKRYSNKEIAAALCISAMTVKRHTVNIYQKLAVGSRREAVDRAIELRILAQDAARPGA